MAVMFTNDLSECDDDTTPGRGWLSAACNTDLCWTRWTRFEHPPGVVAPARARGGRVGGRAGRSGCFCYVWCIYS